MTSEGLENADFPAEDAAMVNSTRIRVGRNLAGYPLGPGVSKDQRNEIMGEVVQACETFDGDLKGTFYPLKGMDKKVQQQLIDDHFLFKEGDRFLAACNLNRDWPEGRGIFHNDAKTFLVWVNEEDHLRIISMQKGGNISEVFHRWCKGIAEVEKNMKAAGYEYMWNPHLGYVLTCPSNLGTGVRAGVHLKIPLVSKHAKFGDMLKKLRLQKRGTGGVDTASEGGIFDISNADRIGFSEVELVQLVIDGVEFMINCEKKLEKKQSIDSDLAALKQK
jgi:creatine kinase